MLARCNGPPWPAGSRFESQSLRLLVGVQLTHRAGPRWRRPLRKNRRGCATKSGNFAVTAEEGGPMIRSSKHSPGATGWRPNPSATSIHAIGTGIGRKYLMCGDPIRCGTSADPADREPSLTTVTAAVSVDLVQAVDSRVFGKIRKQE